jgi:hypothetical protein
MADGIDPTKVGNLVQPAMSSAGDAVKKASTAGKIKKISLKIKMKGK